MVNDVNAIMINQVGKFKFKFKTVGLMSFVGVNDYHNG